MLEYQDKLHLNPLLFLFADFHFKSNESIIDKLNIKDCILEADPLDSELRILDWILYMVCKTWTGGPRSADYESWLQCPNCY